MTFEGVLRRVADIPFYLASSNFHCDFSTDSGRTYILILYQFVYLFGLVCIQLTEVAEKIKSGFLSFTFLNCVHADSLNTLIQLFHHSSFLTPNIVEILTGYGESRFSTNVFLIGSSTAIACVGCKSVTSTVQTFERNMRNLTNEWQDFMMFHRVTNYFRRFELNYAVISKYDSLHIDLLLSAARLILLASDWTERDGEHTQTRNASQGGNHGQRRPKHKGCQQ